ncbi:MAG: hypothetical protein HDT43_03195 [Ruminococcaceae bacterium]|nr:hypothetical protein [Oscillospiraceae bacterium]
MSIFFAELKKLFGNRRIIFMFAAVIIINALFLIIPEYSDFSPSAYNELWDKLDDLPSSERSGFINDRIAELSDHGYFTETFFDNFYEERQLLKAVLAETAQTDNYADYLKSVDDSAENMKTLSFFSDENSFNYRNIIKTQEEFSRLGTENIDAQRSRGVLMAVRFGASDILMILLILIFTAKLLTSEREQGYLPLVRTTANGQTRLCAVKLLALTVSVCFAALVLYGSNIAAGAAVYGLGDPNRGIQSVYGFFSCGEQISVGIFLTGFMLVKLLFCAVFSTVVFMFSALSVGSAAGIILVLAFSAVETALYYAVPATSVFAPFRQINITAAADSAALIGKYLNVNFFGFPINGAAVTVAALLIFGAVCGTAGVMLFSDKTYKRSAKKGSFGGANTSIIAHELYKSFICGKGFFILLAAAIAVIVLQKPVKPYYNDISDYIYYSYISEIQGEYTDEKSEYINGELEAASMDFSEYGKIKFTALEKLQRHAAYLKENGGYFVKDVGYKMLTGDETVRVYDRLAAAVKTLFLIFIAVYSYSAEYRSGAIMLLRSSPNGKRTFFWKILAAALCSLLILLIFDGSRIFNVLNTWGTELMTAPAYSMEHLSSVSMPIISYIILTEIQRFIGMIAVSAAVFFISGRLYSVSVIVSAAVFVVPLVMSAIGFEFMDYFLAEPLLIGNVLR